MSTEWNVEDKNFLEKAGDWLNSTDPMFDVYVPSSGEVVGNLVEGVLEKVGLESTSSNLLSSITSTFDKVGEIDKQVTGKLYSDMTVTPGPNTTLDSVKPYGKLNKLGTAMTRISGSIDIANTWTADSGNSNLQRIEKSAVQYLGIKVASVAGKASGAIATVAGLTIPETGGLSTEGIALATTLDVGAAAINKAQEMWFEFREIK